MMSDMLSPHPDASLLLNISRLGDIIAEVSTSRRRGKDDYLTSIAQHAERYVPLDQRVEDTPALTSEGARAKLALVRRVYMIDPGWWIRFGGIPQGAVQDALRLGISPNVPDRDAELIQACADFDAAQAECAGIFDGPSAVADDEDANAAAEPIRARMNALLERMSTLHAASASGILARARSLALYNADFKYSLDHPETFAGRLVDYLMRDALGLEGAV